MTHLSHGTIVRASHHEDCRWWRKKFIQTLKAGQRRIKGLDILRMRGELTLFTGYMNLTSMFYSKTEQRVTLNDCYQEQEVLKRISQLLIRRKDICGEFNIWRLAASSAEQLWSELNSCTSRIKKCKSYFWLELLPQFWLARYFTVFVCRYLNHSLVGEWENLFGPLFLQLHHSTGFRDILPSCQHLTVQKHGCLVHCDAFPFEETEGKKATLI